MIEFKNLNGETTLNDILEGGVYYNRNYKFLETVDKRLSKLYKDFKLILTCGENTNLAQHGRGLDMYFNSRIELMYANNNGYRTTLGRFNLSCFPDCCGIGIVTAFSKNYVSEYKNLPLVIKLFKAVSENMSYQSIILTFVKNYGTYEEALYKDLDKENFKEIGLSDRRGTGTGGKIVIMSCSNLKDSVNNFNEYLKEYEKYIKEESTVTV